MSYNPSGIRSILYAYTALIAEAIATGSIQTLLYSSHRYCYLPSEKLSATREMTSWLIILLYASLVSRLFSRRPLSSLPWLL